MEIVIAVEDLKKTYQPKTRKGVEVKAIVGISFEVPRGQFFGLLGPNGAGKTTTIGVLTTRVVPTSGTARIEGIDVARNPVAVKRRIGVVPQVNNLDRSPWLVYGGLLGFSLLFAWLGLRKFEKRALD